MKVPQKTRKFFERAAHELSPPAWFKCKQHSLCSMRSDCKSVLASVPSFHLLNNAWVRLWKSRLHAGIKNRWEIATTSLGVAGWRQGPV